MRSLSPLLIGFSVLVSQRNLVETVSHETFSEKVLSYTGPSVVLYIPSEIDNLTYHKEIQKMMRLTTGAFTQSALYFEDTPIHYFRFNLSDCVSQQSTSDMIKKHLLSEHGLSGFPAVILYDAGSSLDIHDREISRFETGVPEREYRDDFIEILNILVYKNIVNPDRFYYAVDDNGMITSHLRE